jgi:hypothetical protein
MSGANSCVAIDGLALRQVTKNLMTAQSSTPWTVPRWTSSYDRLMNWKTHDAERESHYPRLS